MKATVPLTVKVADGHQSTVSAEFIRAHESDSISSLRYGHIE